jgi:hypothetical protein
VAAGVRWTITVTWMDGVQVAYRAASYAVRDGELVLTENDSYATRDDTRHIPLPGIRFWAAVRG